jgi:hypothetical protein
MVPSIFQVVCTPEHCETPENPCKPTLGLQWSSAFSKLHPQQQGNRLSLSIPLDGAYAGLNLSKPLQSPLCIGRQLS